MRQRPRLIVRLVLAASLVLPGLPAQAAKVTLQDGRELTGRIAKITGVSVNPLGDAKGGGAGSNTLIMMVDNDLTRTMVSYRLVDEAKEGEGGPLEKVLVRQPTPQGGSRVSSVGPALHVTKWDEFGRRTFSMNTQKGRVDIVQGITEITPLWTKVEGLRVSSTSFLWDMRIATSSIPPDVLVKILAKQGDPTKPDHRLQVVRLLIQSERYKEAQTELAAIIKDFPKLEALKPEIASLRTLGAQRILREIEVRRAAGQHNLAHAMLRDFPAEGTPGEVLARVTVELQDYEVQLKRGREVLKEFDRLLAETKDGLLTSQLKPLRKEIERDISLNTLGRLGAFENLSKDPALGPEEKLALAVSGWLVGVDDAIDNIKVSVGLLEVRDKVVQYLNEPTKLGRDKILSKLVGSPYFTPKLVASLIENMKPPVATEPQATAGLYKLEVAGIDKEPDVAYYVQLPPEYDPHRQYPTVVSLHGGFTTPEHQLDWWAGAPLEGVRVGQAGRHGYIVIAPAWAAPHQKKYEYSAREHAAVLSSLRDACRRFSIDTDRVYLSGHSMGGDAAWDIGLAHPDLWAGVIPIAASSDKYVSHYWHNGRYLPLYFVGGELDGGRAVKNAPDLDRLLKNGSAPPNKRVEFDVTVVEFQGRGHESFSDEILRIFDWMRIKKRNFFPTDEFVGVTMRPWDNYFYWVELTSFPPKGLIEPSMWGAEKNPRALQVKMSVNKLGGINITAPGKVTVWLSPKLVPFENGQPVKITVNGGAINRKGGGAILPDLTVLLEDVRTRADRKNPFWAKVEQP